MKTTKPIRYGVLGLGHIAQTAVLPAFRHAKKNSVLTCLFSHDPQKLRQLGRKYKAAVHHSDELELAIQNGEIDALYIATPNTDHIRYAEMALHHDIHVLCEKPLAESADACEPLLRAAKKSKAKFMVAYRLHFDPANLTAVETAHSGKIGELRYMSSIFSYQVQDPKNIRLKADKAGGPLHDIGVYCINASRYLFRDEPVGVSAIAATIKGDSRFSETDEMMAVNMHFPKNRIAQFLVSFGAAPASTYDLVGTKGCIRLEHAYEYSEPMKLSITINEKTKTKTYKKHDQFASELLYFSNCIQSNKDPEPSITEGLNDLHVIDAIQTSIRHSGRLTPVRAMKKSARPTMRQRIVRPGIPKPPEAIHAPNPSGD